MFYKSFDVQVSDIPYESLLCADPKEDSYITVVENEVFNLPKHFWVNVAAAEGGLPCKFNCPEGCELPPKKFIDMLVACCPCQPHSKLARRTTAVPEEHNLFYTMYGASGSIISFSKATLPLVVVSENVYGMMEKAKRGMFRDITPAAVFIREMRAIRDEDDDMLWFSDHALLDLDAGIFAEAGRRRKQILRALCYNHSAVKQFNDIIGVCEAVLRFLFAPVLRRTEAEFHETLQRQTLSCATCLHRVPIAFMSCECSVHLAVGALYISPLLPGGSVVSGPLGPAGLLRWADSWLAGLGIIWLSWLGSAGPGWDGWWAQAPGLGRAAAAGHVFCC